MNEDKCYLFFSSYFEAMSASDRLNMYQISNRVVKAPIKISGTCSFAVMVNTSETEMIKLVLDDYRMSIVCNEK